jgi:hypothetical protein
VEKILWKLESSFVLLKYPCYGDKIDEEGVKERGGGMCDLPWNGNVIFH